jgi:1-acyl-sn-glycerol-3-phosphate acyltransferase
MAHLLRAGIGLRARLMRKFFYRIWKSFIVTRAKKYILTVQNETKGSTETSGPSIILCNLKDVRDIYVLMYLFREKEFSFVGLRSLEKVGIFKRLASLNRVIFWNPKEKAYSFLREMLISLRNFNRTIILFPRFELDVSKELVIDPSVVVRIAMMASVPIVPVFVKWVGSQALKCAIVVGKRFFISPSSPEFRDVFFRRKGSRKFSRLDQEELKIVASRIFSKLGSVDGSNIP